MVIVVFNIELINASVLWLILINTKGKIYSISCIIELSLDVCGDNQPHQVSGN